MPLDDSGRTQPRPDSRPDSRDRPVDADALAAALAEAIEGEVRFDQQARSLYSTDASNYRQIPVGVVLPKSRKDVIRTVEACRRFGAAITSRGGGTSLAGQSCNAAVIIDFSKYLNRILALDGERREAWVEPGVVLDDLRDAAAEQGLTFGPDPSTHNHNTLGGMIGNNSCGVHSVMAGRTADNVLELEVLTYDGTILTVGATDEVTLRRLSRQDDRTGVIYRSLAALRDRHAEQVRARYPDIPRRVSGYNLDELLPEKGFQVARALVGSEGTCVVVLRARLRLVPLPKVHSLVILGFHDVYQAADSVPRILEHGPTGLEGLDDKLVLYMKAKGLHPSDAELLPEGGGWLLVEFGGDDKDEAQAKAKKLIEALGAGEAAKGDGPPWGKLIEEDWQAAKIWEVRKAGLAATAHVPMMGETHPGWEDAAVPPDKVGAYLRDFRRLLDAFGYDCSLYGHFGDGCIHCRIDFDFGSLGGVQDYLAFIDRAAELVVGYGGSISGEHGDGQARAALLETMYGPALIEAFRTFKSIWDPDGRMNPGKVVDAYRPDENLRQGPDYRPWIAETAFAYPEDQGDFARAAGRCVGVGECRRHDSGTMCPSYRATREEAWSTRGRARLLFEMMRGDHEPDRWQSEATREALDFCLACKACKNECPVNVDMATYKAEFMHHHYRGRLRPRDAYAMGLIWWWARAASAAPGLANAVMQSPALGGLAKRIGGIAPERELPRFASPSFRDWFRGARLRRPTPGRCGGPTRERVMGHADSPRHSASSFANRAPGGGHAAEAASLNPMGRARAQHPPRVLLWPDTFNGYFTSGPLKAAAQVLSDAGFQVSIPERPLCCGRPLYAVGMLGLARRLWRRTLETLEPEIRDDVPVVLVEPSCASAFRDELPNLFPHDPDARRLSKQSYLLSEFLEREDYRPPRLEGRAVVHGHCHHRAVVQMDAEVAVLKRLGLDATVLDDGCCGMAGDFGFRRKSYPVSVQVAETGFLPAVRETPADSLLIANGFSCREQARQLCGRTPLSLPEVLLKAIEAER
ncbi:FAD/FMN-containing dehydrogenase [Tistlia consotensis]|uniref:FAD/FMN-containing dehydrogenase n=1 Tax=Tistlia consotensis USBA 355 TaxID=560819 RepID=A0A1Y6CLT8_9PROT|nr:FAD-binding and (Fe-S)-binding domain-containing protein [Tistlia consotensis]SMF72415.1 FAD/FMN-containing dehydrogenase [Tistlia consotensis USBA 355]SNS09087.1 FAD/FMN-containing dehydrogenase [Tistlia consotensis]